MPVSRRAGVFLSIAVLLSVALSPVPAVARNGGTSSELHLTAQLRLTPDRPGEIGVRLAYDVPSGVTGLRPELPAKASVTATDGFRRASDGGYEWDRSTDRPTLTYRLPVNESLAAGGVTIAAVGTGTDAITGSGADAFVGNGTDGVAGTGTNAATDAAGASNATGYLFADAGPWALVRLPSTPTKIRGTGSPPTFSTDYTTAGPGAVGERTAFLGPYTEHRLTAHGQTFRLVVPEAANLTERPSAVLGALGRAAGELHVGARDPTVFVVAAPTAGVRWGVRGLTAGGADCWVRADERLDTPSDIWLHEYVHTRQTFATTNRTRWFTEASATYYAALLTLRQGRIGFDAFRSRLANGGRPREADSVLARPSTWTAGADYVKGALVAADIDRRIRLASGGDRTLQDAFARLNRENGCVTASTFARIVGDVGNASVREALVRETRTAGAPKVWDRDGHRAAFGRLLAHVTFDLAGRGEAAPRVSGPYRESTLRGRPVVLVPNETLAVGVRLANDGDAAGAYDLTVRVDGRTVENLSGRVPAGGERVETVRDTFRAVGSHAVTVERRNRSLAADAHTLRVSVRPPAEARVTDVRVDRQHVDVGRPVRITAVVRNGASIPGRATVPFVADGAPAADRTVRLAPGETATVSVSRSFDAPGAHVVGVDGGPTTTVSAVRPSADGRNGTSAGGSPASNRADSTPRPTAATGSSGSSPTATPTSAPGFGLAAAALALLASPILARRR
ncbi:MAG: hypothetical protein ABEJ28_10130 [Salinigranum sp.]